MDAIEPPSEPGFGGPTVESLVVEHLVVYSVWIEGHAGRFPIEAELIPALMPPNVKGQPAGATDFPTSQRPIARSAGLAYWALRCSTILLVACFGLLCGLSCILLDHYFSLVVEQRFCTWF